MQLKPAEFKYQSFVNKWNTVKCISDIDLKFNIPVTSEKSRFESLIFVSKAVGLLSFSALEEGLQRVWVVVTLLLSNVDTHNRFFQHLPWSHTM